MPGKPIKSQLEIWEVDDLQMKLNQAYELRNKILIGLAVMAILYCILLLFTKSISIYFVLAVFTTLLYSALMAHLPISNLAKDITEGLKVKLEFLVEDVHELDLQLKLVSGNKKLKVPIQLKNKVLKNDIVSCEFAPKSLEIFKLKILREDEWLEVFSYK